MIVSQAVLICVFLVHAGLGFFVLLKNPKDITNKRFFIYTQVLALWTFLVFLTLQTDDSFLATLRLRLVFCAALFIPSTFFFFSHVFPDRVERPIDRYTSVFFFAISAFLALSSRNIVESVSFEKHLPHAKYGFLFATFWIYFIVCKAYSLYNLYYKSLHMYGIKRLQIQYLYLGVAVSVLIGSITNFILPLLGIWQIEGFVPLVTVPIPVAVAYAIAKYHLMDIYVVVKKSTLYGTLSIVLGTLYFLVGLILGSLLPISEYKEAFTAIVSTSVIVLTFVPIRESIQYVIEKSLFCTKYSHAKILHDSTLMLSSIHDLNGLLHYAIRILYDSVGIDKICILLKDKESNHLTLRAALNFPLKNKLFLARDSALSAWLCENKSILSREQLSRFSRSAFDHSLEDILTQLDVDCCIPIFQENDLFGVILLGRKVDKKPFTQEDIEMFLAFSGQLAMAIHNADLYAGLKEAKTYRDNILQSLKSGIVVLSNDEEITLINNEAKRIIGMESTDSSRKILKRFGKDAYQLLKHTLKSDTEYHNIEGFIERESVRIPCGMTTVQLKTEAGEKLGALMILTDLTELKLLQKEKQNADRLASLGAIAANIAHEIKNPLVAINTYFQLLPYKRDDEEFHSDFQKIAVKELKRINKIIEEMLNLAKPSKPLMQLTDPNCAIREAVSLLKNAAEGKRVEIAIDLLKEKRCELIADEELIKRVLINILQNSLDSVPENGRICISTGLMDALSEFRRKAKEHPGSIFFSFASPSSMYNLSGKQYFAVKVSDNGTGIPAESMPHLFEPFFTTKDKGNGLGLAIIYAIVKDHEGGIYVESRKGVGTDFYIALPLRGTITNSKPKDVETPLTL